MLKRKKFFRDLPDRSYENETKDISNDVEQVTVQNTALKVGKEVKKSSEKVKMAKVKTFRTIGTQNEDVPAQKKQQ